jgi:peptide/nickel transport system permease protein/oligopeptide transport system permease protein
MAIPGAIMAEAGLSFIGLGISPPTATWGQMLQTGREYLRQFPWLSIWPGMAILITVLAFNLFGDGLRDALDPYLKR